MPKHSNITIFRLCSSMVCRRRSYVGVQRRSAYISYMRVYRLNSYISLSNPLSLVWLVSSSRCPHPDLMCHQ